MSKGTLAFGGSTLRKYFSYSLYAIRTYFLKQESPYMFVLMINDKCNLNCFYCASKNSGKYDLQYPEVVNHLEKAFLRGNRTLVITGGEPMLFKNKEKRIRDIVKKAREIGFFEIAIFTNGTQPLNVSADRYFVSIDGDQKIHDKIRNNTYNGIIKNVTSADADVIASITITKENRKNLNQTVENIVKSKVFKRITFNFLTHFPEIVTKFGLTREERQSVLNELLSFKKRKYPILLSKATYKALYNNSWKRPIKQIELAAGKDVFTCCKDVNNPEVCKNCGYSSCVELSQVLAGKPSAIMELIKTI